MSRTSLGDPRHNSRISLGSRRRKSGISTVVSAVIMIAAISIMGSVMLIWAKTTFNAQQRQIGNTYETNSNLLKETFIVEDVWLNKYVAGQSPANYVNVTIRNIGDTAITVSQIQITGLTSNGSTCTVPNCSVTANAPFNGALVNGLRHYSFPLNSNGLVSTKQTLRVDVNDVWSDSSIKSLNIQVTTARGSIQSIVWQVA